MHDTYISALRTMGFFGIFRDLTQSYTALRTGNPRDSVNLLGKMINRSNRQQLISKLRTSAMKAELDCVKIFEQGQRTADSLVQSVPIISLSPSSLLQLSSFEQMGELEADIDDVGRYQDVDNDDDEDADDEKDDEDNEQEAEDKEIDDEDAGQGRVRQMGMAQTVIYVEPGGTPHINF
jgi:hypothetical protein